MGRVVQLLARSVHRAGIRTGNFISKKLSGMKQEVESKQSAGDDTTGSTAATSTSSGAPTAGTTDPQPASEKNGQSNMTATATARSNAGEEDDTSSSPEKDLAPSPENPEGLEGKGDGLEEQQDD